MRGLSFQVEISNRARSGFSIIEVAIALLFIIVTVTIFGVAVSTVPLTKTARNQNIAYHVAAKKIEEFRNTPFVSLPPSGSFTDPGLANLASSTASYTIASYQGSADIKQVTVIVNWDEQGMQRSTSLETLISKGGLNKP